MATIQFNTPVVFHTEKKTRLQQAVECVDEYFYRGKTTRVSIMPPDAQHPQPWARECLANLERHWISNACKIVTYFTFVLPLIARCAQYLLRSLENIHSIKEVEPVRKSNDRIQKLLPKDSLLCIAKCLGERSTGRMAQTAHFAESTLQDLEQSYTRQMEALRTEITALPPCTFLPEEDFQRLFEALLASPLAHHPRHWTPLMDRLMGHYKVAVEINALQPSFPVFPNTIAPATFVPLLINLLRSPLIKYPAYGLPLMDRLIKEHGRFSNDGMENLQQHTEIAKLLESSELKITAEQMALYCNYLLNNLFSEYAVWFVYRVFEQYKTTHPETVTAIMKEFLAGMAEKEIRVKEDRSSLPPRDWNSTYVLKHKTTDIDPRIWFGCEGHAASLWVGDDMGLPGPIREAIWTRIQKLQAECQNNCPLMVEMTSRAESHPPGAFLFELAQDITNAHIFLEVTALDPETLAQRSYAVSSYKLCQRPIDELREQYPNAVVLRRQ